MNAWKPPPAPPDAEFLWFRLLDPYGEDGRGEPFLANYYGDDVYSNVRGGVVKKLPRAYEWAPCEPPTEEALRDALGCGPPGDGSIGRLSFADLKRLAAEGPKMGAFIENRTAEMGRLVEALNRPCVDGERPFTIRRKDDPIQPRLRFDVPAPDPDDPGRQLERILTGQVAAILADGKSVSLVSGDRTLTTLHPSWFRHDTAGTHYSASAGRGRVTVVLHRSEDGLGWAGHVYLRPCIDRDDGQLMPSVEIVSLHIGMPTKAEACAALKQWLADAVCDMDRWAKACAGVEEDPAVVSDAAAMLIHAYLERPPEEADPPEG